MIDPIYPKFITQAAHSWKNFNQDLEKEIKAIDFELEVNYEATIALENSMPWQIQFHEIPITSFKLACFLNMLGNNTWEILTQTCQRYRPILSMI